MTTEKKMTKYDRNFKFNVSYAEVGQKYEESYFCKGFINSQFAEQFIKEAFENNPEMIGKGMYFVAFDNFPLYTVECKSEDGIFTMVERSYYGATEEEAKTEEVDVEEVKEETKSELVANAPTKQVPFTKLWEAWEMYYGSTQSCSKAEAKRWIKACHVIFGDAKTAAEYLCEHVKEMNK